MPGGQPLSKDDEEGIIEKYDCISVLINEGDGFFGNQQWYDTGKYPHIIEARDVNNDGFVDMLTTNGSSDDVSVLLNRGDGTFRRDFRHDVGPGPTEKLIATDMNNDGFLDIIVTCGYNFNDISVLLNTGSFNHQFKKLSNKQNSILLLYVVYHCRLFKSNEGDDIPKRPPVIPAQRK